MDEYTYPQRTRPPVQAVTEAKCREHAALDAAAKQCGRNGLPFMDDRFDEPGKSPATHEETEHNRDGHNNPTSYEGKK